MWDTWKYFGIIKKYVAYSQLKACVRTEGVFFKYLYLQITYQNVHTCMQIVHDYKQYK